MEAVNKEDSYSQFMPLRQSSTLGYGNISPVRPENFSAMEKTQSKRLFEQDSYSEFLPLRQSSALGDSTLQANGTDINANTSTKRAESFLAKEKTKKLKLEKVHSSSQCDSNDSKRIKTLNSTLSNSSGSALEATFIDNFDEILRIDALGCASIDESMCEMFYTALDFTQLSENEDAINNEAADQENLDDTLPMDDTPSMDDTLLMDNNLTLDE